MAELADALDSGSSEHYAHRGSSPLPRTRLSLDAIRVLGSAFYFAFALASKRVSFLQRKPSREPRRASRVRGLFFSCGFALAFAAGIYIHNHRLSIPSNHTVSGIFWFERLGIPYTTFLRQGTYLTKGRPRSERKSQWGRCVFYSNSSPRRSAMVILSKYSLVIS